MDKNSWKLKTARDCFKLFVDHLEKDKIVNKLFETNDIDKMNINEIKYHSKTMYMKYIVERSFSSPENTVTTYAYKHIVKIIDDVYSTKNIINEKHKKNDSTNNDKTKLNKKENILEKSKWW